MPWKPSDAKKFQKKAKTPAAQRQWAEVSNSMLKRGFSDARAIKAANSVVKKRGPEK